MPRILHFFILSLSFSRKFTYNAFLYSFNLHLFIAYHKLESVIEELRNMRHRPSPGFKEPEVKKETETLMIKKLSAAQMITTLHDMKKCLL